MAEAKRKVSTARKTSRKPASSRKSAKINKSVESKPAKKSPTVSSTAAASLKPKQTTGESLNFDTRRVINTLIWLLVIFFSFLLVDLLVQYLNNDYSVAVVNGTRLKRSEFNEKLEDMYGKGTVDQMITEALVRQQADEEGIEISSDDIDEVVQKTKDQLGGEEGYKNALEESNLTEEDYRADVELRLMAQKLVVEEPSDEELKNYFESYKALYFNEEDNYEDVKEDVEAIYYNQKFNEQSADWLEDLKKDSQIQNNVEDKPSYGLFTTTREILEDLF